MLFKRRESEPKIEHAINHGHSNDKYLPIWVLVVIFAGVFVLSIVLISSITVICKIEGRCSPKEILQQDQEQLSRIEQIKKDAELKIKNARAAAMPSDQINK